MFLLVLSCFLRWRKQITPQPSPNTQITSCNVHSTSREEKSASQTLKAGARLCFFERKITKKTRQIKIFSSKSDEITRIAPLNFALGERKSLDFPSVILEFCNFRH